jgi:hypothetical protein
MEPIAWNGSMYDTWVVVYRSEPGKGASRTQTPRGMLWVRPDGTVLRQEATLLDTKITFIRLPRESASLLAARFHELTGSESLPRETPVEKVETLKSP